MQKAFLRSEEDQRADRDPSTFAAGHTIEFCLSRSGDCTDSHDHDHDHDHDDDPGGDDGRGEDPDDSQSGRPNHDDHRGFLVGAGAVLAAAVLLVGLGLSGIV